MQFQDLPLLLVALIVFAGIFVYLCTIDTKMRRLESELRDEIASIDVDGGKLTL